MSDNLDLNSLSSKELKDLLKTIDMAIDRVDELSRTRAIRDMMALAKQHGFKLEELLGIQKLPTVKKKRLSASSVYVNPADSSMTWSGRGRRPTWLNEAQENGFEIQVVGL